MTRLLFRPTLSAMGLLLFLVACGSSPAIPQRSDNNAEQPLLDSRTGSWMLPEAKSGDLLYVTNYSDVLVFTYPQAKLVGTLKGFYSTAGDCVDSKGDVFITNTKPTTVYEYAHGGTKRIASYPTKKAGQMGCAISPTTGDLAISGGIGPAGAYVEIFRAAKGRPVAIEDHSMWFGQVVTYDNAGNLFFLGLKNTKGKLRLSELKAGSKRFIDITPDAFIYAEGGMQWSGSYLTAVSYIHSTKTTSIGQFQVIGTKAHLSNQTPLNGASTVLQYFIYGQTAIIPNFAKTGSKAVLLYNYPAGGNPTGEITEDNFDPRGVVVSHV